MNRPLEGKAIVITGAGGGLGAAYARHAAGCGAHVVVNDITPAAAASTVAAIEAFGGEAIAVAGDISEWAFASRLVEACVDAFGAIDGFVSNAGIFRPAQLTEIRETDLRRMLEINVIGTAAGISAAARWMLLNGRPGSIVAVASGSQAGDIALGGYGATKGAVASLTYSWAMELRDTNVRLNAISPLAETAMSAQNADLMAVQAANRDVHYASLPDPSVNAPVVSYLLSDQAAGIHGQVVRIANRELSLVTHPMIAAPVMRDDWDFEKVSAAFDSTLRANQRKLGLGYDGT